MVARWRWLAGLRALGLAIGLACVAVGIAWAHPSLVRSEPAANATLDRAPAQVAVWLDEAIEPDYAHLSVWDASGQRVDRLDAQYVPGFDPYGGQAGIVVSLPPLPHGSYVVVWRVIAVGDGHAVGGAFAFGVGVPPDTRAAAAANAEANSAPDLTTQLIRFLSLIGQAVFLGAVVFRSVVLEPGLVTAESAGWLADREALRVEQRRWLTVCADIVVGALVTGTLGGLYVQSSATGVFFWELFGTRWGVIWLARAALVLAASLLMEGLLDGRRPAWLGWLLGLGLALTTTLTSHSSARPGLAGPVVDFVHQVAAGAWLGGLVMLVLALLSLRRSPMAGAERGYLGAEWVARFSGLAAASVGGLMASGLLLATQQVPDWKGLLLTEYGQTLLVKFGVVGAALALGAYNALAAGAQARRARSPGRIAGEAALVAGVIFAAAVMVDLPPATAPAAYAQAPGAESTLAFSAQAGAVQVAGQISPARQGTNAFAVTVTDASGAPVRGATVSLRFQARGSAPEIELTLAETGEGEYTATGAGLRRQGDWGLLVSVARPGAAVADYAAVNLVVGLDDVARLAGTPLPATVRTLAWLNRHGRMVVSAGVLLVAVGWSWFAVRALPARLRPGWLVAGLLVAGLLWVLAFRAL
jgi:copper transport protein